MTAPTALSSMASTTLHPPLPQNDLASSILFVLAPCVLAVALLMCCARIFFVYFSYRRERRPQRSRFAGSERNNDGFRPDDLFDGVFVVHPPPTYDQLFKEGRAAASPPEYTETPAPSPLDDGRSRCLSAPPPGYSSSPVEEGPSFVVSVTVHEGRRRGSLSP